MIERIHLSVLREVYRTGTLTEAAANLCLTQSALSHAIKKLEQQLGIQLWERRGRGLHFTRAGHDLLVLANRLLPQFEHAEQRMREFSLGQRGILRIGMECHPCYQWLLPIVSPFLMDWPGVDVDVKQAFQFGGLAALFNYDIDVLITPDPLFRSGLVFQPVFDYELVLAVPETHILSDRAYLKPEDLNDETLLTYPVPVERLDVYSHFLVPANCQPKTRKTFETTDIMLHMVAAKRGVSALPDWLVAGYCRQLPVRALRLGKTGLHKQIHIGIRETDAQIDYIKGFVDQAKTQSSSSC